MAQLYIIDVILFVLFATNILYLLIFSIASLFYKSSTRQIAKKQGKIAILIPAYKEDMVIEECVDSCLAQSYPSDKYDVVVISDRMSDQTDDRLRAMPIKLVKVNFENSTKSKALNYAMANIDESYDIALILDADNTISPDFLSYINDTFDSQGVRIIQAHRCAKNTNTPLAMLDAVSEEINNSIFRKGHTQLGLSAALIGSGMAFEYMLLKNRMLTIDAVGGFDRALELSLLKDGVHIHYLSDADVLDEKVQHKADFSRQRRRWLSAQWHYFRSTVKYIPEVIRTGNWDFGDKIIQQMTIPRVVLLGLCLIISVITSFVSVSFSIKWWLILAVLCSSLWVAVPRNLYRKELFVAIIQLPYFFVVMALNLFRLRGANKKFIHTTHGLKNKQ